MLLDFVPQAQYTVPVYQKLIWSQSQTSMLSLRKILRDDLVIATLKLIGGQYFPIPAFKW
jgi:hypothetical protein